MCDVTHVSQASAHRLFSPLVYSTAVCSEATIIGHFLLTVLFCPTKPSFMDLGRVPLIMVSRAPGSYL